MQVPPPSLASTVDAVLQQQLLSPTFRVYDRCKGDTVCLPGARATFTALRDGIMEGVPVLERGDQAGFIAFLSNRFNVPEDGLHGKLATLPTGDAFVDTRLELIIIVSAMREHWHALAYQQALASVHALVAGRLPPRARPSLDQVHEILTSELGPAFSHLVNVHELRAWATATGTRVSMRGPRLAMVNRLAAKLLPVLAARRGDG